jgi:hypothetical protein
MPDANPVGRKDPANFGQKLECLLPVKVFQHIEETDDLRATRLACTKEIQGLPPLDAPDSKPLRKLDLFLRTIHSASVSERRLVKKIEQRPMPTSDIQNAGTAIGGKMIADYPFTIRPARFEMLGGRRSELPDMAA